MVFVTGQPVCNLINILQLLKINLSISTHLDCIGYDLLKDTYAFKKIKKHISREYYNSSFCKI